MIVRFALASGDVELIALALSHWRDVYATDDEHERVMRILADLRAGCARPGPIACAWDGARIR